MGTKTRAERQAQIAEDDGDPKDTVVIAVNASSTARSYHEDQDCRHAQDINTWRELTRAEAQSRARYPCSRCVLGTGDYGVADQSTLHQRIADPDVTSIDDLREGGA